MNMVVADRWDSEDAGVDAALQIAGEILMRALIIFILKIFRTWNGSQQFDLTLQLTPVCTRGQIWWYVVVSCNLMTDTIGKHCKNKQKQSEFGVSQCEVL